MGGMQGAPVGILLVSLLIGIPIGILIGAIFLRLAVRIVSGVDLAFGRACGTVVVAFLANFVIGFILGFVMGIAGANAQGPALNILSIVINFFVSSGVYGAMVKDPASGQSIGYGKGMLVTLMLFVFALVIGFALGIIIFLIGMGAR